MFRIVFRIFFRAFQTFFSRVKYQRFFGGSFVLQTCRLNSTSLFFFLLRSLFSLPHCKKPPQAIYQTLEGTRGARKAQNSSSDPKTQKITETGIHGPGTLKWGVALVLSVHLIHMQKCPKVRDSSLATFPVYSCPAFLLFVFLSLSLTHSSLSFFNRLSLSYSDSIFLPFPMGRVWMVEKAMNTRADSEETDEIKYCSRKVIT